MYDRVNFVLRTTEQEEQNVAQMLSGLDHNEKGFPFGFYKNFCVTIIPFQLCISGSLPRYYLGSSLSTLTVEDTRCAIEQLSKELNIDLSKGHVSGLEFGANLIMDKPVSLYLAKLGTMPYLKRQYNVWDESLYYTPKRAASDMSSKKQKKGYRVSNREIIFYDKRCWANDLGIDIPPILANAQNILRYEVSLDRLKQHLKKDEVSVPDLWDKAFYAQLVELWYETYCLIRKIPTYVDLSQKQGLAPDDILTAFIMNALQKAYSSPAEAITRFQDEIIAQGASDSARCSSFEKRLLKKLQKSPVVKDDACIKELDQKIKAVYDKGGIFDESDTHIL